MPGPVENIEDIAVLRVIDVRFVRDARFSDGEENGPLKLREKVRESHLLADGCLSC